MTLAVIDMLSLSSHALKKHFLLIKQFYLNIMQISDPFLYCRNENQRYSSENRSGINKFDYYDCANHSAGSNR